MSPLTLCLFGPFAAQVNGVPLPHLRTRKGQWLLALLTLRHGAEVERAWLAGILWPDCSEPRALANLRTSLADLRDALGEVAGRLRSPTPHSLALDLSEAQVDVLAFDQAVAGSDPVSMERAVALYRGPLLEGCGEEWVFQERQVREQAYLQALEGLAAEALARGAPGAAEGHLRRAVGVDPLRESAQRELMQALAAGGNYAAALLAYRELRLRLHRELNAEPDPETTALFQQLRGEARGKAALGSRLSALGQSGSQPSGQRATPVLAESREPRAKSGSEATHTFLFTDIEGSTRLWEEHAEAMRSALARHDALLRHAIEAGDGTIFKTFGDQFCAVFVSAPDALAAAMAAQRDLQAEVWGEVGSLRVRMALHTGTAEERDGDYFGPPLNRVARLLATAHGGQVLLSLATAELVRDHLPEAVSLRDLGERRLQDLVRPEHLFQLVIPDLPAEFPPLRSLEAFPHNLPLQLTRFIGREPQIADVKRLLTSHRFVTLTGAGGCGKTRLSLQVAAELLAAFADGVWFVELAPISDPNLVPQTGAAALGVSEEPGRLVIQTLVASLKAKQLLLVLDNCEHLLAACAHLAESLLKAGPNLRILASSREGLGIAGETTYRVPSLSLPDPKRLPSVEALTQFEAVRLFAERAAAALPSFALTDRNASTVAQVCHRLDGIPLAIELAAARVKVLPVEKIAERLDDRFRLLTGGSRTALPRQRTLRALIDWSYDLLSEPERAVLCRLSVFSGGWTLEAAEAVCSGQGTEEWEVLDLLTALVEKSLVLYDEQEDRYRLLETMRQYGRDRLLESGEGEAGRERHRDFFLQLAEELERNASGEGRAARLDRLEMEHDNLRAALEWSLAAANGMEAALRLAAGLGWFWGARYYLEEGRQWLTRVLSRSGDGGRKRHPPAALRANALHWAGSLACTQGDYVSGRALLEESLELRRELGDRPGIAGVLGSLGAFLRFQADYDSVRVYLEECLAIRRELGDRPGVAATLGSLGWAAHHQGDLDRSRALHEECVATLRALGSTFSMAGALNGLGYTAWRQGDYGPARAHLDESIDIARKLGQKEILGWALTNRGRLACSLGEYALASALQAESLAVFRDIGSKTGAVWIVYRFAELEMAQGRAQRAARLFGAAEAAREATDFLLSPVEQAEVDLEVAALRAALGQESFAAAWAEGRGQEVNAPDAVVPGTGRRGWSALEDAVCVALEEADIPTPGRQGS